MHLSDVEGAAYQQKSGLSMFLRVVTGILRYHHHHRIDNKM